MKDKAKIAEKLKETDNTAKIIERDDIVYDPTMLPPPKPIEKVRHHYPVDWAKIVHPIPKPDRKKDRG